MNIDEAPRCVKALRELSVKDRLQLFNQLYDLKDESTCPPLSVFKEWDVQQQADWLLTHLLKHDQATDGYVAVGVPLPVRTGSEDINRQRWMGFAEEVAEALNSLQDGNYQSISTAIFAEHGLIITGFRLPAVGPGSVGGVQFIPISPALTDTAKKMGLMSILTNVEALLSGKKPTAESVEEAVGVVFERVPTEALTSFIEFAEIHVQECAEDRCKKLLPLVAKAVRARLNKQLC